MNKFELQKDFETLEPIIFLKNLLKDKEIKENKVITQFIKLLLDKIKEFAVYNTIAKVKAWLPGKGNGTVEPGAYDYTHTLQYDDKINNLMKAMGVSDVYSDELNIQKYNILKAYLKENGISDIKNAEVYIINDICISVDGKSYGFMDQAELKEFCKFLGSQEELDKVKDIFLMKCKNPDLYIVDADNDKYREFLFAKNFSKEENIGYFNKSEDEAEQRQAEQQLLIEMKTFMIETGFSSDEHLRYNYETGTVINCYENDPDIDIIIPNQFETAIYNENNEKETVVTPVREIDMIAFDGVAARKIVIPQTVEIININDDIDLSKIKNIEVDPQNKNFKMVNNVLCNRDGEPLRKKDLSVEKFVNILDQVVNTSIVQNGSVSKRDIMLNNGNSIEITATAQWVDGQKEVSMNIMLYDQEENKKKLLFTNSDYEYESELAKDIFSDIVIMANTKGIENTKDREVERINPIIRSFNESINRETKNDYGFKGNYYIIDANNSGNYIEMNSSRYEFKGKLETETTYKVFHNNQEMGNFSDKKDDNWNINVWLELRRTMKNLGCFSNEIAKVYNEKDFEKYREQLFMDEIQKSQHENKETVLENVAERETKIDLREIQFDKSFNRDTKDDYGFIGKSYIIDANNSGNYIEMEKKSNAYATTYRVFHENQEIGAFSDKDKGYMGWLELRNEMKSLGGFSDNVVKVYSENDLEKYQEQISQNENFKEEQEESEDIER